MRKNILKIVLSVLVLVNVLFNVSGINAVSKNKISPSNDYDRVCRVFENDICFNANKTINITSDESKTISDVELIELADVYAFNIKTNEDYEVELNRNNLSEKPGVYIIDFSMDKFKLETIVIVSKSSNDKDVSLITAKAFYTIDINEVGNLSDEMLISKSGVKAWDIATSNELEVKVIWNINQELGSYEVIFFETATFLTYTTRAVVIDEFSYVDNDSRLVIRASNFTLDSSKVTDFTTEKAIADAKALAFDIRNNSKLDINVSYNEITKEFSSNKIEFSASKDEYNIKLERIFFVVDENVYQNNGYLISANNFVLSIEEVSQVNREMLFTKANVRAFNFKTGENVSEQLSVDETSILEQQGIYDINFKLADKINKTVKVFVRGYEGDFKDGEFISANNFVVNIEEVKAGLSDSKIIEYANARAYSIADNQQLQIMVDQSGLVARVGLYQIKFNTELGSLLNVSVLVVDDSSEIDTENNEILVGTNFEIYLMEFDRFDDAYIIESAKAMAFNLDTGQRLQVEIIENEIKKQRGTYHIKFQTENGLEKSVRAIVRDANTLIYHNDNEMVFNDLGYISVEETRDISDNLVIERANLNVIAIDTGKKIDFNLELSNLKANKGKHTIIVVTPSENLYRFPIIVHGENIVFFDDNRSAIDADNIIINRNEAALLDAELITNKSELFVFDTYTAKDIKTNIDFSLVEKGIIGSYPINISWLDYQENLVKHQIRISIVHDYFIEYNNEIITGNNFITSLSAGTKIKDENILALSNTRAFRVDDNKDVKIEYIENNLKNEIGSYSIYIEMNSKSILSIKGIVVGHNYLVDTAEDLVMSSNNAVAKDTSIANMDKNMISELASIRVFSISRNKDVDFAVDLTNLTNELAKQRYNIIVNDKHLESVLFVNDARFIESEVNGIVFIASPLTLNLDELNSLDEAELIARINAKAYDIMTTQELVVSYDVSEVLNNDTIGNYQVVLSTVHNNEIILTNLNVYVVFDFIYFLQSLINKL